MNIIGKCVIKNNVCFSKCSRNPCLASKLLIYSKLFEIKMDWVRCIRRCFGFKCMYYDCDGRKNGLSYLIFLV